MVMILDRAGGLFGLSLQVASRVDNLLALVGPTVLASRMGQEWRLTGRAHTDVGRLHGIMSPASANA